MGWRQGVEDQGASGELASDSSEDSQLEELADGGAPEAIEDVELPTGNRAGERRSLYLRQSDFERHGFTDGCPGCRDIAVNKPGPKGDRAAHSRACRTRMESTIKEADPARWERYRLRKRDDKEEDREVEEDPGGEDPPEPPAAADGEEDAVYSDGEAGPEDLFGYNGPESASALTDHKQEEEDRTAGTASRLVLKPRAPA